MVDFSKLLHNEFAYNWEKQLFSVLEPYPYLADIIVILAAFTCGTIFAVILYGLLRYLLQHFYRRRCQMNPERQRYISRIAFSLVTCLPVIMTNYYATGVDMVGGAFRFEQLKKPVYPQ